MKFFLIQVEMIWKNVASVYFEGKIVGQIKAIQLLDSNRYQLIYNAPALIDRKKCSLETIIASFRGAERQIDVNCVLESMESKFNSFNQLLVTIRYSIGKFHDWLQRVRAH